MNDDVKWHGYDRADIYAAQDDVLMRIDDGEPILASLFQRLPPLRAALLARIAITAGGDVDRGTLEQVIAEAKEVGGNGKLGDFWTKHLPEPGPEGLCDREVRWVDKIPSVRRAMKERYGHEDHKCVELPHFDKELSLAILNIKHRCRCGFKWTTL